MVEPAQAVIIGIFIFIIALVFIGHKRQTGKWISRRLLTGTKPLPQPLRFIFGLHLRLILAVLFGGLILAVPVYWLIASGQSSYIPYIAIPGVILIVILIEILVRKLGY